MRTYGKASLKENIWTVTGEPHVILRMKRLFKKSIKDRPGEITLSHTPENCRDLVWFFERYPMQIHLKHAQALEGGSEAYEEHVLTINKILAGKYSAKKLELAIPARDYQLTGAQLLLENKFLIVADDVGVGKTALAICAMMEPRTRPVAIVTLTHLPQQWRNELARFAPQLTVHIIKGTKPYELPVINNQKPDVLVINYHKLSGWCQVLKDYCKMVVFDECQELRRTGSDKYCAAKQISSSMDYRLGLSATPFYNYGIEMYNVASVLKEDCLGDRDEFTREWCVGDKIANPKAFGSFLREKGIMIRRTRKDVGREIPDVSKIPHYVDSDSSALDHLKGSAAELAKLILSANPLERGDAFNASGKFDALMRQATGIAKAPYVADFVRLLLESGERVVLFGWHHEVYSIWQSKLEEFKPLMYTGAETPAQKEQAKQAFLNKESPLFIMSLRAGAGLDGLQSVCRTAVFGELDWSPGILEQCLGRLARDGQPDPVTGYFLIAEDGADPIMADTLGLKTQQIEGVLNPNKDLIEKLQTSGDHIKKLAQYYLDKIGVKPEPVSAITEEDL